MFKKKLIALGLCVAMVGSMVACGDKTTSSTAEDPNKATAGDPSNHTPGDTNNPLSKAEMLSAADKHEGIDAGSIVSFEDANTSFVVVNDTDWGKDKDIEVSVGDYFSSKMLCVSRPNGGNPAVAIDIVGLLGSNASKCKKITVDVGLKCKDVFSSGSGAIKTIVGEDNHEIETKYSIYKPDATVKTVTIDLGDATLTSGNYMTFSNITDAKDPSGLLLDNIIFYDASNNALPVDTSIKFAVDGCGEYDWSNGVKATVDEKLLFTGAKTGTGWWPDAANAWCWTNEPAGDGNHKSCFDTETFAFGPGDVITIYYSVVNPDSTEAWQSVPYIRVNHSFPEGSDTDAFGASGVIDIWDKPSWENWEDDKTPGPDALVNESKTICQIPYEIFAACCEAKGANMSGLNLVEFAGVADRGAELNIVAVTVGKAQ